MVEGAEAWIEHVARVEVDAALAEPFGYAFLRQGDECRRKIHRHHFSTALRRFDGECPGAAAGVEKPAAAQVFRHEAQQRGAHAVASGAHRGADAAHGGIGGEPRPGISRRPVEIGFDLAAALGVAVSHQSNPRKSKISRSFMERASQGSEPAQSSAARRRYSFCT